MFLLVSLTTYSRWPLEARLIGSFPCVEATDTRCTPELVTRNEVTLFDPALTTKISFPSGVVLIEPDESTIGKPNGGSEAMPLPPVETLPVCVSLPSAPRLYTHSLLPLGLFVAVTTQPPAAFEPLWPWPCLEAAFATHGISNAMAASD